MKENLLVKYNNDMNSVGFGKFKEKELDLFFSICFKVKELGVKEIEVSFSELRELSSYSSRNLDRFIKDLSSTYDKMLGLNIQIKYSELDFEKFNLFNSYKVTGSEKKISIQVSEKFEYILNNLIGNYTKFDLIDFVRLKSTYSKNAFKFLKQWESIQLAEYNINKFKELLGVPQTYSTAKFNERVLKPIMTELPQYFSNLKLEKIKTGQKVTSLKFTWDKRNDIIEIVEEKTNQIIISQNLYNLIKEIQSLNFFQNVMTPRNIEKLTKKYDEKTLVQILKRAKAHTYQQIKSIKYFDSVYESIKTEPVITIKPAEKIVEKEVSISPTVEKIEKIDITREEFDKKYKEYLKKNNSSDDHYMKISFGIRYNIVEVGEKRIQDTKVFTEKDIPENELLGKNGKKLVGAALKMRIKKILNKNDLV